MYRSLIAVIASLPFACGSCAALTLTTEEYPPFNMMDARTKTLVGISVEKVTELMRRAHEPNTLDLYPWPRAYQMALQSGDTCVFSTTRTPEREALFAWIGPLVRNDWVIFARADDLRKPKSLADLHPYTLGGYNKDAVGEFLKLQGYKVDFADNDAQNVPKLLAKHIDFWATGELMGHYLAGKAGASIKIVPLFRFKQTELYLACNPSMAPAKVEEFNRILKDMDRDGASAAIERKYQ